MNDTHKQLTELAGRLEYISGRCAEFKLNATDSDIRYHNAQREVETRELAREIRQIAGRAASPGVQSPQQ